MSVDELLRQLDAHQNAFRETAERLRGELANRPFATEPPSSPSPSTSAFPTSARRSTISFVEPGRKPSETLELSLNHSSTFQGSAISADSDSDDDDEAYYVQQTLPASSKSEDELRRHLREYPWDEYGRKVLDSLIPEHSRLTRHPLFQGPADDTSHSSHFEVFDVGPDGAPLQIDLNSFTNATSKASAIWHAIKDIHADTSRQRRAVGRITIAREPSPILFAALHLTMNDVFHMDELFRHLVESEASSAPMYRAFADEQRKQRTFVFNLEYYTIIGDECKPMSWQSADKDSTASERHIPLSRCSSVVALTLYGDHIRKVRNSHRRASTKYGYVYDPWGPWQVLNIQCYPDWKSRMDTHDSTKHYVNGPEAFLHTLLAEYKDAQKRFDEIYRRITKLITPEVGFIFDPDLRDARLFEDKDFTFTRRYFWAHQTLGAINDSIKAIIDAFEDTFTEDVWEGKHKTLWRLVEDSSPRNEHWKKRLRSLKKAFDREIESMKVLIQENNDRRAEIRGLRDQLFSGTSVLESRKSVELSEITIQQGHNIKLLTLVNMIFVPLTFVTSVFGMTNMPETPHRFWPFAIATVTICVPFFLLIGSMNTTTGMNFWRRKSRAVFAFEWVPYYFLRRASLEGKEGKEEEGDGKGGREMRRSKSAQEGLERRAFWGRGVGAGKEGDGEADGEADGDGGAVMSVDADARAKGEGEANGALEKRDDVSVDVEGGGRAGHRSRFRVLGRLVGRDGRARGVGGEAQGV